MNASDCPELRQLNNQVADLGDSMSAVVRELAELRRVLWAQLVYGCGSWEVAGNCYIWGLQGADQVRKKTAAKGGDE